MEEKFVTITATLEQNKYIVRANGYALELSEFVTMVIKDGGRILSIIPIGFGFTALQNSETQDVSLGFSAKSLLLLFSEGDRQE